MTLPQHATPAVQTKVSHSRRRWQLHLLTDHMQKGAVCLDGSAAGLYHMKGVGADRSRWLVHFSGGGWCSSVRGCAERAKGALGSSRSWPDDYPHLDGGQHGLMSPDPDIAPSTAGWHKVFIMYCDGSSFTGDVEDPIAYNGTLLYFRGARVRAAVLDTLVELGLGSATDVIVKGCSAGAVAAVAAAAPFARRLPGRVRLAPDGGVFLDHPPYAPPGQPAGPSPHAALLRAVYELHNATGGVLPACAAALGASHAWRCLWRPVAMTPGAPR